MSLDYIKIPMEILKLDLSDKAKMLLGLVCSYSNNGLYMSNENLAELFGCHFTTISRAITELLERGLIEIKGNQSRWRKIYISNNAKVKDGYTLANPQVTLANPQATLAKTLNRIKKNKKELSISKKNTTKKPPKKFIPPTIAEVEDYIDEKGFTVDAKKFIDYYTELDWHDKEGKPVKNWKLKIISVWDKPEDPDPNGVCQTKPCSIEEAKQIFEDMKRKAAI